MLKSVDGEFGSSKGGLMSCLLSFVVLAFKASPSDFGVEGVSCSMTINERFAIPSLSEAILLLLLLLLGQQALAVEVRTWDSRPIWGSALASPLGISLLL